MTHRGAATRGPELAARLFDAIVETNERWLPRFAAVG
jgi:hypothetical protein